MTTLFSDDFESGDLTAWTTIVGNPVAQNTLKRTGEYACSSTITSSSKTNSITKTLASQTSSYLRFYLNINALPSGTTEFLIARCAFTSSRPLLSIYKDSLTTHWRLRDGGGTIRQYATGPELQTWYCVELKAVVGDESAVYVNGEKILSGTAPSGSSSSVLLLAYTFSGVADGAEIFFDDVAYSDTYNGPQNLTQTITDDFATDDLQLCNKQFLTADNLAAIEKVLGNKPLAVTDYIADQDSVLAFKKLLTNEDLTLSETPIVGIRGHTKTKLFLDLAGLTVQLTGD